jgi:hypothetical protein
MKMTIKEKINENKQAGKKRAENKRRKRRM